MSMSDVVEPPLIGEVTVYATSATDNGWIDLLALAGMGSSGDGEAYFTFKAETSNVYLFFSDSNSSTTDPLAAATTGSNPTQQADVIFAGTQADFVIRRRSRYVKPVGTAVAGFLRITRTSK